MDLAERLLGPQFEAALEEIEDDCISNPHGAYGYIDDLNDTIRELHARLEAAKAEGAAAREALDAVDSTLSECRYSFEVGRPLPCNCDIHAAHKIIDAARAGGGK